MSKKKKLYKIADKLDDRFDAIKKKLLVKLSGNKPIMIQPYRGFGNHQRFHFMGRVLIDKGLKKATDQDSKWENLLAMYKRFNSDEISHATLTAVFQDQEIALKTDKEGYFQFEGQIIKPLPKDQQWHTLQLKLKDEDGEAVEAVGGFLIPPSSSNLGIISDIDDTVLRTNSSDLLKMARLTLLNNAHTRLPFKGVAALYRALHKGTRESSYNPMFYVSSSPWNLYDLLEEFFELHHIPMGPFLLRDLGIDETKFIKSGHGEHKLVQIENIMTTYPEMKFILIGDSGEKDPEIFEEVVKEFKNRVECIYIRDVSKVKRDQGVQKLIAEVSKAGVEMLMVENSEVAAIHAAEKGYIDPNYINDIVKEKIIDENAPDDMEQLMKGK